MQFSGSNMAKVEAVSQTVIVSVDRRTPNPRIEKPQVLEITLVFLGRVPKMSGPNVDPNL